MKPKFPTDHAAFSVELRKRVQTYFQESHQSPSANGTVFLKALFLFGIFFALYYALVFTSLTTSQIIGCAFLEGVVVVLIGLNVLHECAHGNYFENPFLSRISAYLMDVFGISSRIYQVKRLDVHHRFTNIHQWDGDVDEGSPLMRLSDRLPYHPLHRYQYLYAPFLYALVTFSWVTSDDFRRLHSMKVCAYDMPVWSRAEKLGVITAKILHLLAALGLPSLYHPFGSVLAVYVFIHVVMGVGITLIFQVAHVFESSYFAPSPTPNAASYGDWMVHQLKTTADFSTQNPLTIFLMGGLNYQVEHHLFPNMSYIHLPAIQKIVKTTCKEYGVPYHEYPSFISAIRSHFRLLKKLGQCQSLPH